MLHLIGSRFQLEFTLLLLDILDHLVRWLLFVDLRMQLYQLPSHIHEGLVDVVAIASTDLVRWDLPSSCKLLHLCGFDFSELTIRFVAECTHLHVRLCKLLYLR